MIYKNFITFEGGEGSGKSTQIKLLKKKLSLYGDVILTREPGGSKGAEDIRKLLVKGDPKKWSGLTEVLLNYAARNDHIENIILHNLKKKHFVISDRYSDSTIIYQGYGRGVNIRLINRLDKLITNNLKPFITILLDIKPEVGIKRSLTRKNTELRYEQMPLKYHKKINSSFLKMAKKNKNRFLIVDANLSRNQISNIIWLHIKHKLKIKN